MHMPTPACSPQLLKVTSFGRKRTEVQFELKRNNESSMSCFFFKGNPRVSQIPLLWNCCSFYPAVWPFWGFWKSLIQRNRRRQWQATPVLLPRKSRGWRSLVGCSPWGRCKLDATERLHFHFSLSHHGEGNGNPLQCPCLENPRDGRAWWAAVHGVAQSRTRLKRLSSSNTEKLP